MISVMHEECPVASYVLVPYCPVYKPRFSDANLGSENIPRPIHRVRNVDH